MSVLADSPAAFARSSRVIPCSPWASSSHISITGRGLQLTTPLCPIHVFHVEQLSYAMLQCRNEEDNDHVLAIPIGGTHSARQSGNNFFRVGQALPFRIPLSYRWRASMRTVYLKKRKGDNDDIFVQPSWTSAPRIIVRMPPIKFQDYRITAEYPNDVWNSARQEFRPTETKWNQIGRVGFLVSSVKSRERFAIIISDAFEPLQGLLVAAWLGISYLVVKSEIRTLSVTNYLAEGSMQPRTFFRPLKFGWLYMAGERMTTILSLFGDINPLQPCCWVVEVEKDVKRLRDQDALSAYVVSRNDWQYSTARCRTKGAKHSISVTSRQEFVMGEKTIIVDMDLLSESQHRIARWLLPLKHGMVLLAMIIEWRQKHTCHFSLAMLPTFAVMSNKVSLWSYDGLTLYWKTPVIWTLYLLLFIFQAWHQYHGGISFSTLNIFLRQYTSWCLIFLGYWNWHIVIGKFPRSGS